MTELFPPVPGYQTPADLTGITELRVHGVSGTPPASMLQHPDPEQVVEGHLTGFFRRPRWSVRTEMPGESPVGGYPRRVEAYSWGNLTSGASTRALWLLLAPFALVNMAAWMHPAPSAADTGKAPTDEPPGAHRVVWRLLALSLTATLMLTAVGIGPDLVGWQCSGRGSCATNHAVTSFLAQGWWHQPSRAVAAAMALPALLLALLWWLGRATWQRYELPRPHQRLGRPTAQQAGRSHRKLWSGREIVGVLRSAHVAVALAVMAFFLATPGLRADSGTPYAVGLAIVLAAAVTGAGAALLVSLAKASAVADRPADWQRAGRAAVVTGAVAFAAALGYALAPHAAEPGPADATGTSNLPGFTGTIFWLFAAQLVLLLAAVVAVALSARRAPKVPPRPGLAGLAGPVLALNAVVLGAGMTAGASIRFADWLGKPTQPSATVAATTGGTTNVPLALPEEYTWVAFGFAAIAVALVVILAVTAVRILARTRRGAAAVLAEPAYADEAARLLPADATADELAAFDAERLRRARAVTKARVLAGVVDELGAWVAGPAAIASAAISVTAVAAYLPLRIDTSVAALSLVQTGATWLLAILPLALIATYRAAAGSSSTRHTVGILWDLTTFWPRSIHPLAPPCYSERAVPDLVDRLDYLTDDGAVILSTHSQGTVLGLSALLAAAPEARRRTFMITYGSPLGRLYARYWPAYFGGQVLAEAASKLAPSHVPLQRGSAAVGGPPVATAPGHLAVDPVDDRSHRWRNAWRRTDPIGGRVFPGDPAITDIDTQPLTDPDALVLRPGDVEPAPIRGHSGYFFAQEFLWLADRAAERLAAILDADRAGQPVRTGD